jgi:type I restriction enzyme S subunit
MKPSGVAWFGDIPEEWEVKRLKCIASCNDESLADDTPSNFSFDYVDVGSVKYGLGIVERESMLFADAPSRARRVVRKDDVIVSTVRTYLKSVAQIPPFNKPLIVSTGFAVLRARNADAIFLSYALQSQSFVDEVEAKSTGISYPAINASDLVCIKVPVPPLPEQRAIADYLDEKCGAIDAAIAEAKKGIEEYKAWKISLIDDVVCNGIVRHKCRKETGEVWLTDIPDEWEFTQIRYLFALRDERNDKPLKDVNLISLYTDKGVVQHADLEKTTGNKASTADGYKLVYENDIVVNIILCWMGAVGRSAYNGVTSPAYDVYRPINPTKVLSRYYHYLFRTPRFNGKCYEEGRGIMMMRWRTYSSEFRAIKVPVPPIEEQRTIADYLDGKCTAIDAMVAEKEALIADLEAYKKSLIYEVVTGKREVA